jgi:hypothetical protein
MNPTQENAESWSMQPGASMRRNRGLSAKELAGRRTKCGDPVRVLAILPARSVVPLAILLTGSPILEAGDLTRVELKGRAKAFATHTAGADEFWIGHAIDGDLETHWVGEGHPLTEHPTSIVIEFPQPTTVARLVLVSEIFRDRLQARGPVAGGRALDREIATISPAGDWPVWPRRVD